MLLYIKVTATVQQVQINSSNCTYTTLVIQILHCAYFTPVQVLTVTITIMLILTTLSLSWQVLCLLCLVTQHMMQFVPSIHPNTILGTYRNPIYSQDASCSADLFTALVVDQTSPYILFHSPYHLTTPIATNQISCSFFI